MPSDHKPMTAKELARAKALTHVTNQACVPCANLLRRSIADLERARELLKLIANPPGEAYEGRSLPFTNALLWCKERARAYLASIGEQP